MSIEGPTFGGSMFTKRLRGVLSSKETDIGAKYSEISSYDNKIKKGNGNEKNILRRGLVYVIVFDGELQTIDPR